MSVRAPLFVDGSNDLEEMSAGEVDSWVDYICYLYGTSPSVTLTVDSGGSQNRTAMSDTRLQAGAQSTSTTAFPSEGTTAEPSTVTVSYDRLHQTNASISPTADSGTTWPVYQTNTGGTIQAMTLADVKDTFLHPAIDKLVSGTEANTTAGTYTIATTTTLSNNTRVSTTPIFIDTRADTSAYTSGGIPETLDQPDTKTNYYLFRRDPVDPVFTNVQCPVYIDGDNNIKQYSEAEIEALFLEWIRETASESGDGYQLTYDTTASGAGNTRGSGIADTKLNGSGNYQTRFVGLDDYRAQEFPNGASATITTYYLRINKA